MYINAGLNTVLYTSSHLASRTSSNVSMLLSSHVLLAPHPYHRSPPQLPQVLEVVHLFQLFTSYFHCLSLYPFRLLKPAFHPLCFWFTARLSPRFQRFSPWFLIFCIYQINDLHTWPHRIQTSLILVHRFSLSVLVRPLWIRTGPVLLPDVA